MKKICFAFFLACILSVSAQESAAPMVTIPLIASDSHHRPTSLTVDSLVVRDQRQPVTGATLVRGADLPVELGLLIDVSTSQRSPELSDILKAARQFVNDSVRDPDDRVFLMDFDATPRATEWLTREQSQTTGLKIRLGGATALYDALTMASKQRMGPRDWRKPTRRVLVLISDGDDNMSHVTRGEATDQVLKAGVVIFAIATGPASTDSAGAKVMQTFAAVTGGGSFVGVNGRDAPNVFATIKEMIDNMYYLRYVPPDASKSAFHEVELKRAQKEKFELTYARRYFWNQ